MTQARMLSGSEKEIAAMLRQPEGRQDLTLLVPAEGEIMSSLSASSAGESFYLTATPEELQQAFDALGAGEDHHSVLPPEAFERESLYDEDRF